MGRIIAVAVATTLAASLFAQTPAVPPTAPPTTILVAGDQRPSLSLDGAWHYILDPYNNGTHSYPKDESSRSNPRLEYDFAKSPTLQVPGDWNMQSAALLNYEGPLWYERHFDYEPQPGTRAFLHIGAANYRARAYVNGQLVCTHEGGFTPFDCEITRAVKAGSNSAVIMVDSTRLADGVPTLKTDWFNYGGLTRDVSILTVPSTFIDDFDLHLDRPTRSKIEGYVHVVDAAPGTAVEVEIPEAHLRATGRTDAEGRAAIEMDAPKLALWSPQSPKLYKVKMTAQTGGKAGGGKTGDSLTDSIGFRTIEVAGSRILLNGQPIVLHGVCIHAEAPVRSGRVDSDPDVTTLLTWVKQLDANYVRLAHYPHDERMTRAADRMGILVWSEVPVYWAEHFEDEAVYQKSQQQLGEEIRRDRDKASVILWSIANETPNNPVRTAFLKRSAAFVHQDDPTRLVTAALLVRTEGNTKIIDDPLGTSLDVVGFNEYIGWYDKDADAADTTVWKTSPELAGKPLIVSEFGAAAKYGLHGPVTERWTEEYQANVYKHQIPMLNGIPHLRGDSAWVLMDFRSPIRVLPGIQDGFNRKGLISNLGQKKQAFFVLQKAYQDNTLGHAQ
jgi:beta-glucuronidase